MNFIISAETDIGLTKQTNQDSYAVRVCKHGEERMVFAVLCDGMGGLAKGEVASASLVQAYLNWVDTRLPQLLQYPLQDATIYQEWCEIARTMNSKIKAYGTSRGINLGTTLTVLLLTGQRYYILNVGDTRACELVNGLKVLTVDQTLVAQEVRQGILTPEQAERDPRRSVLLQCVGASEVVNPDFFCGEAAINAVYMLCSDGFRHEITPDEIFAALQPAAMCSEGDMRQNMRYLIDLNKQRQERDNITVVTIRTF